MSSVPHPQPRITLLARLLHQHYAKAVDVAIRSAGIDDIRPSDAKVFPFVPADGIAIAELALRAGVRKQTMAESVDRLVTAGYLERIPNPNDRRSRLLVLTERGQAVRPVAAAAGEQVEQHWAQVTSPEHVETLRSLLQELIAKLDEQQS